MTTKPKARKFRIRRNPNAPQDSAPDQHGSDVAAREPLREGQVSSARETSASQNIEDIRKEGLTGRELRMARRMAQKHGLAPTSDFDAVRLLRAKGIDPFQRGSMLELVAGEGAGGGSGGSGGTALTTTPQPDDPKRLQLPQTVPAGQQTLPSTDVSPADRRADEIGQIQRDIAKRRRRKQVGRLQQPQMSHRLLALFGRGAEIAVRGAGLPAFGFRLCRTAARHSRSQPERRHPRRLRGLARECPRELCRDEAALTRGPVPYSAGIAVSSMPSGCSSLLSISLGQICTNRVFSCSQYRRICSAFWLPVSSTWRRINPSRSLR